jgi:hypothetical protein
MRSHRRAFAAGIVLLAILPNVSCGDAASASHAPVVIVVDLEAGQRWTALGAAVEGDRICPDGIRHVLEGIDPATNDVVPVRVWSKVIAKAIEHRTTTEITLVVEYTCADGSGSFVTTERWGPDVWSVDSGTGAYGALRGRGALSFAALDYRLIPPLWLELEGVLEP